MSQRYAQLALALMLPCLPLGMAMGASGNCNALGQLPAVIEVGEGLQTELQSPVAITRLAIGDPKIADVRVNGDRHFLLTGVGSGATSLMVWTGCSTTPRQSMVFVKGKATSALTSQSLSPSEDPTLPSQVQTDIRFVEVSRTKLKEASTKILGMGKNFFLGSPDLLSPSEGIFKLPVSADNFNIGFGGGRVKALINALESSGFAYTLARPSLVVPAAIPSPSSTRNSAFA